MQASVRMKHDVAILDLEGTFIPGVDGSFLRQKTQDLLDANVRKLVFSFSGVPYIDSTGLGFLAASRSAAEQVGAQLALCSVPPQVRKILDRVQLTKFFLIAEDENAAIALLTTASPKRADSKGSDLEKEKKPR
jgi:anti-anti-sigma factor